ncbi:hypothetical protein G6F56_009460 [Rhizopus delemar]|uniref:Sel1 repeat family protein n=1 Tax=Rhizopus stolonifer TaxID=4846 RepID=A0A367KNR1_RHIST|nr:hypothetical protein G6F56_009460 [Rhizopus delemar]RCI03760.1 hypothetical protein CU098_001682 [Rhizopus stolonifer]
MDIVELEDALFPDTAVELYLLSAVQLIQEAINEDENSQELAKQALRYLRIKAAKGDIEAKIKLSTILEKQPDEANLWARSIFDRKLSAAIAPCASQLISVTEEKKEDQSLLERMIQKAKEETTEDDKKGKKASRNMSYLVGILFVEGMGVKQDVSRGLEYLTKASEMKHEIAGLELAKILSDPFKYPKEYNMEKSLALYEGAVDQRRNQHSERALIDLARVYYEGSETVPRDIERSYKYARRVAGKIGEQYCQFIVGDVLLNSQTTSVKQDVRQAIFWLTQSAEQGFPLAIETLSKIYFEGKVKGIKQDYEKAYIWCMRGDDLWPSGLGYCQTCLGDIYREGLGMPKDIIRSFEYYQKAATQQDAPQNYARYMLGEMFFRANGWKHDLGLAEEYYKMAANENYEPACNRLNEIRSLREEKQKERYAEKRNTWRIWSFFGGRKKQAA